MKYGVELVYFIYRLDYDIFFKLDFAVKIYMYTSGPFNVTTIGRKNEIMEMYKLHFGCGIIGCHLYTLVVRSISVNL